MTHTLKIAKKIIKGDIARILLTVCHCAGVPFKVIQDC